MPPIYISYRPADAAVTELIVQRCLQTYGRYSVVMNPQLSCPSNIDLKQHIDNLMHSASTILLIIGNNWAGLDKFGRFKLSTADIPVGLEVQVALRKDRDVIMVLVNGADLPAPDVLPDDLQGLYGLPVAELRPTSFYDDLNHLIPPPSFSERLLYFFSLAWAQRRVLDEQGEL